MFDPFFPLVLLGGPLTLVMLVVYELQRRDRSLMPRGPSIGLAIVSAGGLWVWLIALGVERWGKGMDENGFGELVRHALLPAIACVVACYCLLAALRSRRSQR